LGRIGGDEAIIYPAPSLATDPETAVRQAGGAAMRRTRSADAIAPLIQALLDDHRFFRRAAPAPAPGGAWRETAVEALARAVLLDPSRSVREAAAEALGKIGSPEAAEVLVGALGDVHSTVRESAAAALDAISGPGALGAPTQAAGTDADPRVRQNAEADVAKPTSDETGRKHHHRRRHRTETNSPGMGTDVR